ncbi:MAG TPA: hypothetical protein VFJ89_12160 [Nocardioides sp.]|jgi:hypothetical protein|nr:hypothetical protein [Nocardioides sp.]
MGDQVLLELFETRDDHTPEEVEEQTQGLRRELLDLEEVGAVGRASAGEAPPGSRAVDVAALGALIVAVEPTITALSHVVSVVRDWLSHRGGPAGGGSVKITVNGQSIELSAATADQQHELVDEFISTVGAH